MDFDWNDSQRDLGRRISSFAEAKLGQSAATVRDGFDPVRWGRCGEFGLLGLCAPTDFGGLGLDPLSTAYAMEAFGRGCDDFGLVFSAAAHLFACVTPLAHHADASTQTRLLPALCRGELVGANAISEAGAGSDTASLTTRAVRDGDSYVLDGVKTYVTNAPIADVFMVYATTNPSDGLFGLSAFVVERGTPGLTIPAAYEKEGLRTAPLGTIQLERCRVRATARVGREGHGRAVFTTSMLWERSCLFAGYLGAMERQLLAAIEYARERRQFGRPIASYQAVSHRLVNVKLRLEAARLLVYRACWGLGRSDATMEIALAKLAVSEAAVQTALDCIRVHGAMGVIAEAGVGRALWEAVPSLVFSGTNEIQREVVARKLGL